jgi:hypothetical protein
LFYDESFLLALASTIGTPVRVDTNTLNVERGRFARICVEIDLTKPVVGKVWINGHWYKVQYEGLHIICAACGCYGHVTRNCTKIPVTTEAKEKTPTSPTAIVDGPPTAPARVPTQQHHAPATAVITEQISGIHINDIPKQGNNDNNGINAINAIEVHGDWMVVTRKKRNHEPKNQESKRGMQEKNKSPFNSNIPGGTRYNGKGGVANMANGKQKNQNFEVGTFKKGGQTKKRRFDNVANLSNVVGSLENGSGGNRKGPTQKYHQEDTHGSGRPVVVNENQRTQNSSPPIDFVLLRRETNEKRKEDGNSQLNGEGHNLQHTNDQDEELECVQETPMDGGQHQQDMCQ